MERIRAGVVQKPVSTMYIDTCESDSNFRYESFVVAVLVDICYDFNR